MMVLVGLALGLSVSTITLHGVARGGCGITAAELQRRSRPQRLQVELVRRQIYRWGCFLTCQPISRLVTLSWYASCRARLGRLESGGVETFEAPPRRPPGAAQRGGIGGHRPGGRCPQRGRLRSQGLYRPARGTQRSSRQQRPRGPARPLWLQHGAVALLIPSCISERTMQVGGTSGCSPQKLLSAHGWAACCRPGLGRASGWCARWGS